MQSPSESASLSDSCECSHVCEPSSKMSKAASSRRLTTPRLARETTEQRCRRRSVQPPVCFAAASVWLPLSTSKRSVTEPSPAAQSRGRLLAAAAASMECNRLNRKRRGLGVGQRIRQWHPYTRMAALRSTVGRLLWPCQQYFHLRTRIRKDSICSSCFLIALMQTKGTHEWSRMKISVSSLSPEWSSTCVRLRQKAASLSGTSCAMSPTWSFPLRSVPARPLYLRREWEYALSVCVRTASLNAAEAAPEDLGAELQ